MKEILIACGDVDLLRQLVNDLPPNVFKPIATRRGAGVAKKLGDRAIHLAIIHANLEDDAADALIEGLRSRKPAPPILYLSAQPPPPQGPFDVAIRYPVPGPVFRNALNRLIAEETKGQDLDKWKVFYKEVKTRLARAPEQNYFEIIGVRTGAPHHVIVKAFDILSLRYHPDRYNQFRSEKWGVALHEKTNVLYKLMTEAYSVLTDRRLRSRYDAALEDG
ncbi:MAG: J domain-containing protein, partial [Bradymonadaceae bacterium]